MKKTLTVRPLEERTGAPVLQRKGRGWNIAESRLDTLHETARELRRNPTPAQVALAEGLIAAELGKYRFRRQVVIGSAIVDFACQPLKFVVEVDEPDADPAIDRRRDASLEQVGIKVVRVPAAEVLANRDAVVGDILAAMKLRWQEQRAHPRSGHQRPRSPASNRGYQK